MDLHGYHIYRPSAWILAEGEDTHEFLQSQFSNDVSQVEEGESCYGLWLDQKGKVHGDSQILKVGEERIMLFSYFTSSQTIIEKLEKFIVADDVELNDRSGEVVAVSLFGRAIEAFETLDLQPFTKWNLRSFPGRRSLQKIVDLVLEADGLPQFLDSLPKHIVLEELEADTVELHRLQSRIPHVPRDIGPNELPQEGGLETDAVNFTKGCYLGQEVMSRLHSMGRVRRSLQYMESDQPIPYEETLYFEGKKVGVTKTSIPGNDFYAGMMLLSNAVPESAEVKIGNPEGSQVATRAPSADE